MRKRRENLSAIYKAVYDQKVPGAILKQAAESKVISKNLMV